MTLPVDIAAALNLIRDLRSTRDEINEALGETPTELAMIGHTDAPFSSSVGTTRIVVLISGWVLVGQVTATTATETVIENASTIRVWGTTKGLGELALGGPTAKTVLDRNGTVRLNPGSVIMMFETEPGLWSLS